MKKLISNLYMIYRLHTSRLRSLPDYLIIGAQKSGSTSLYDYLIQHPEISSAKTKEVHYFSNNYEKGIGWYRAHFGVSSFSGLVGEATPYYLYHPLAACRIQKVLPDVKIIIVLRDPSARAISHYHHAVNHGFEKRSIKEAFESDLDNYGRFTQRIESGERLISHQENSYISRGFYDEQLARYYELFDHDNILLISSNDLFSNTLVLLKKVFTFLNVSNEFVPPDTEIKNQGNYKKASHEDIDEIMTWLSDIYESHGKELETKYGIKFLE